MNSPHPSAMSTAAMINSTNHRMTSV
jgi:hypothetical protein